MPYVQPLETENASPEAKTILEGLQAKVNPVPNIFRTFAHRADILEGVLKLNNAIKSDLPGKFRELAYNKASRMRNCNYCLHYHLKAGKAAGLSADQLGSLDQFADSPLFDDEEKAVLAFTEQVTNTAKADAAVMRKLKTFLTDSQLVTLVATVGLAAMTNFINDSLEIQLP